MPNYRSLIGGFFSATPMDKASGPVSIRMNNPGAVNGASWERTYPGYVDEIETTPGNRSTIFESPENGIAAWWELLRRYRSANAVTVEDIINRYGGGQDYSAYLQFVLKRTGFARNTVVDLDNDQQLLNLGRAMFRYEAGRDLPWSDGQILFGLKCGRQITRTGELPASVPDISGRPGGTAAVAGSDEIKKLLQTVFAALGNLRKPVVAGGKDSTITATPILSPIDQILGGGALAGKKTMLAVMAYVVVAILQAAGIIGVATPAGQILMVLTTAIGALGGLAKVDRIVQALGVIAAKPK